MSSETPSASDSPEPGRVAAQSVADAGWMRWVPGLRALFRYKPGWLLSDVTAGLVLATVLEGPERKE